MDQFSNIVVVNGEIYYASILGLNFYKNYLSNASLGWLHSVCIDLPGFVWIGFQASKGTEIFLPPH
jgi:hypothetical protein